MSKGHFVPLIGPADIRPCFVSVVRISSLGIDHSFNFAELLF